MRLSFLSLPIILSICAASPTQLVYTDGLILPTPLSHYQRYLTVLAVGTRTYLCPTAQNPNYTLSTFDYDMYDVATDPNLITSIGKHVLLLQNDFWGGRSVFYTAVKTFTYWVGPTTFFAPNPAPIDPLDLSLEQELRSEASEPKSEAGVHDLGVAVYVTRFGAKGGNVPPGAKCRDGKTDVKSRVYYSFWKHVA